MSGREFIKVGKISHYFVRIGVAVIELIDMLSVGDRILIKGANTYFEQAISSMQIEHAHIDEAKSGQSIGLKVEQRVREGDEVYKIV